MTKRHARYSDKIDQMKRDRLGWNRHSLSMVFNGIPVASIVGAPVLLRDRWIKDGCSQRMKHIALERLYFTDRAGQLHTAKRFIMHDVKSGHVENIGRFFDLHPV